MWATKDIEKGIVDAAEKNDPKKMGIAGKISICCLYICIYIVVAGAATFLYGTSKCKTYIIIGDILAFIFCVFLCFDIIKQQTAEEVLLLYNCLWMAFMYSMHLIGSFFG